MVYSSNNFVFLFPALVIWFYLLPTCRAQNLLLAAMSIGFISFTGTANVFVALGTICFALGYFALAQRMGRGDGLLLVGVISGLLLSLGYFKYRVFFAQLTGIGLPAMPGLVWTVPLGISFYTFQIIGAIYDRRLEPAKPSAFQFSLYVLFFAQLIAGPIVKFRALFPQFEYIKRFDRRNILAGGHLFVVGYCKKVLLADPIGRAIDPVWAAPQSASTVTLWLAAIGFYIQVYADFSGYTDMGRGIARALGFRLPINFRAPYLAASPADFWSRWHITLSNFIKYYVYNSLAVRTGRMFRSPTVRRVSIVVAMIVTMVLIGLWHGGAWRFVLFGLIQGLFLAVWYLVTRGREPQGVMLRAIGIAVTQAILVLSFVVFRAETPELAATILQGMFVPRSGMDMTNLALLCLGGLVATFAIQLVDYNATSRGVAVYLLAARRTWWVGLLLTTVFVLAFVVKQQSDEARLREMGGVFLERFIYFDF